MEPSRIAYFSVHPEGLDVAWKDALGRDTGSGFLIRRDGASRETISEIVAAIGGPDVYLQAESPSLQALLQTNPLVIDLLSDASAAWNPLRGASDNG